MRFEGICESCKKSFVGVERPERKYKRQMYCSSSCYYKTRKGVRIASGTEFKKGLVPWNKGKVHSIETRRKISLAHKGKPKPWLRGENSPLWKGESTKAKRDLRLSPEGRRWRMEVLARDDFRCRICGKRGGALHADHIMPFALFPELRLDLKNGRTLCVKCHRGTSTYGKLSKEVAQKLLNNTSIGDLIPEVVVGLV